MSEASASEQRTEPRNATEQPSSAKAPANLRARAQLHVEYDSKSPMLDLLPEAPYVNIFRSAVILPWRTRQLQAQAQVASAAASEAAAAEKAHGRIGAKPIAPTALALAPGESPAKLEIGQTVHIGVGPHMGKIGEDITSVSKKGYHAISLAVCGGDMTCLCNM